MGEFEIPSDKSYIELKDQVAWPLCFTVPDKKSDIIIIWVWFLGCHVELTLVEDNFCTMCAHSSFHQFDQLCFEMSRFVTWVVIIKLLHPIQTKTHFTIYLFTELLWVLSSVSDHVKTRPFPCISCMFVCILYEFNLCLLLFQWPWNHPHSWLAHLHHKSQGIENLIAFFFIARSN